MNDDVNVDAILVKMAASSDPAVRAGAMQYKQLLAEKHEMEGLIAFYGRALLELDNAPKAKTKPVVPSSIAKSGPTTQEVKEFVGRMTSILESCGKETKLNDLYELYYQKFPHEKRLPPTTFRQRITKKIPDTFCSINRKYWIAGRTLPSSNGLDQNAA